MANLNSPGTALSATEMLKKRRDSQDYFSSKISDLARNIGYGLTAIAFALLSSDASFATNLVQSDLSMLVFVAVAGAITALLDYLQMLAGWFSASRSAHNEKAGYDKTLGARVWDFVQHLSFYLKQVSAISGALVLLWMVARRFT